MWRKPSVLIAAAFAVSALLLAAAWFRGNVAKPPAEGAVAAAVQLPSPRVVAQAQVVPIDGIIEVRPLAEGRVLKVLVHPGDRVDAQQLLAEIESDMQSAELAVRQAELEAANERLRLVREGVRREDRAALAAAAEAALHEAEMARDKLERQQQLRTQGFVSDQSITEARQALAAAEARAREARMRAEAGQAGGRPSEIRAARQQVSAADAVVSAEKVQLERTRIVAPVAGVVMTRNVNPGDIIGPNVTAPTLFKIVDPSRVEVRLEIEELLAGKVNVGMPVRFVLPGSQTQVGSGKLTRVAPQVEKRSIGADDARMRADSMIRPAWGEFVPLGGQALPPINYRLEAWVEVAG